MTETSISLLLVMLAMFGFGISVVLSYDMKGSNVVKNILGLCFIIVGICSLHALICARHCHETIIKETICPLYTVHLPNDITCQLTVLNDKVLFVSDEIKFSPKNIIVVQEFLQEFGGIQFNVPARIIDYTMENINNLEIRYDNCQSQETTQTRTKSDTCPF